MPDRVILREQGVFTCEFVVIRHKRIVDDSPKLLVLGHDDYDVIEVWNKRFWRGSWCGRGNRCRCSGSKNRRGGKRGRRGRRRNIGRGDRKRRTGGQQNQ